MTVAGNGAHGPASTSGVSLRTRAAPALAILIGSSVWGLAWFPYRVLAQWGVAAIPAQICTAGVALLLLTLVYRRSLDTLRWSWLLVGVAFAGGTTNVAFVWGTTHGHVMRVLLLFYLTPVWTALFAHWLLGERVGLRGGGLIALALGGAGLMLWSPELGWPVPNNAGEWAGAVAGAAFALNNVLLRRVSQALPDVRAEMRSWTLYLGCVVGGGIGAAIGASIPSGRNDTGIGMVVRTIGDGVIGALAGGLIVALIDEDAKYDLTALSVAERERDIRELLYLQP